MAVNLAKNVNAAFRLVAKSLNGVVKTITYQAASPSGTPVQAYNPATGEMSGPLTAFPNVRAIFLERRRREREEEVGNSRRIPVEIAEMKCLIPYTDLPISISASDLILENGRTWRVVSFTTDPSGSALHTLTIKQA